MFSILVAGVGRFDWVPDKKKNDIPPMEQRAEKQGCKPTFLRACAFGAQNHVSVGILSAAATLTGFALLINLLV